MNLSANQENILLLEQLAEHAEQAFFIFDCQKNKFTYISPAYEEIWDERRTLEGPAFSKIMDTVLPDDQKHVMRCWNWYKLPQRPNHKAFEFRINTVKNNFKWVCLDLYLIFNDENTPCLAGWANDITDRKQFTNVMLKFTARKNAALEILSHELSGFLGLIQNLAGNLVKDNGVSETANRNLEIIQQICKSSTGLISNLVNHEFLESASVKINKERENVVAIIQDVIATYRSAQQNLPKNFILETNKPVMYANVDDVKFMQVVNNLVSNALKFTPDGGTIKVLVEEKKESILLSVSDNGIGIPENLQPILFDKFTEAGRPGLRGETSVGLGMSIIRNMVDLHGGKMWFESQENIGTTFYIELPKD